MKYANKILQFNAAKKLYTKRDDNVILRLQYSILC